MIIAWTMTLTYEGARGALTLKAAVTRIVCHDGLLQWWQAGESVVAPSQHHVRLSDVVTLDLH